MTDRAARADFDRGFTAGYQAVKGSRAVVPPKPPMRVSSAGFSPFIMGIRTGLRSAGVKLD